MLQIRLKDYLSFFLMLMMALSSVIWFKASCILWRNCLISASAVSTFAESATICAVIVASTILVRHCIASNGRTRMFKTRLAIGMYSFIHVSHVIPPPTSCFCPIYCGRSASFPATAPAPIPPGVALLVASIALANKDLKRALLVAIYAVATSGLCMKNANPPGVLAISA